MSRHLLKSNRGLGMIEVVIVSGFLALAAWGITQLVRQLASAQKYSQQASASSNADMMIRTVLSNKDACIFSLTGLPTDGVFHPVVLKDSSNGALGMNVDPTLKIKTVQAKANAPVSTVSFVQVEAVFEKIGTNVVGAREQKFNYFINVVKDAGGAIIACLQTGENGVGLTLRKYEQYNLPITGNPTKRTIWMQHNNYDHDPPPAGVFKRTYHDTAMGHSHQHQGPTIPIVASGNKLMISTRLNGDAAESKPCHSPLLTGWGHLLVTHGATTDEYKMGSWTCGNSSVQTMPPTLIDTVPGATYTMSFRAWMRRICLLPCPNTANNYQAVSLSGPEVYIYHYLQVAPP